MPLRQIIFMAFISVVLLLLVLELVRRRKLREEYAWLWLLAAVTAPVVVVGWPIVRQFTRLVGADEPVSVLYLAALVFLMIVNIHYSTKISRLTEQVKDLAQAIALSAAQAPTAGEEEGHTVAGMPSELGARP